MITGILNSVVQLDLTQKDLDKFKVLKISPLRKKLFCLMALKNLNVRF